MTANRLARLDSIRALGVLLVVAYHTSYRFEPPQLDLIGRVLRVIGWMGVDLFFALSGFLIGMILAMEKNRRDIALFFRKRFFRIVPIFVVAVITFGVGDWLLVDGQNLANIWKPFLFLTGYMTPFQGEALVPYTITWSLSVEVSAYILLGLLAWKSWDRFKQVLILVVLLSLPLRIWLSLGLGWEDHMIGLFPPARFDAIALGALAALGTFDRLLKIKRAALIYGAATIAIIILFRFATWYPPFIGTVGYLIFGLAAALWVGALARVDGPSGWFVAATASVGLVSYFMYLFHLFFIQALMIVDAQFALELGFWSAFLIASALTYVAGLISWHWFEKPLNAYASKPREPSLVP
ncbi:acyltransferase family protein [Altererythrobacter aestiaquae]|uniref:Acyltransferase family protein n=2 Tax=Pontixanthobacter aestiaquae TaxID=1509367 RepID=A0A844Z3I2_9SPHN|nr:acyltransferase [Pontixanthobacter aestiaquae]MXO82064.1 acyltransferase family protein [Pontixanthobacter aestiaquae]